MRDVEVGLTRSRVGKPVFKGGKIPSNLLVFGGRGWENAGHVGYGANAGREKQPETARSGAGGATGGDVP